MNTQSPHCTYSALLTNLTIVIATIAAHIAHPQKTAFATEAPTKLESDKFYRADEVQSVYLKVKPDDQERMLSALPERIQVPASFRWRDISLDNVAIRFKGNSSSAPMQQHKRSLLIRFDEYDDQKFLGLQRVSFDNAVQFGSLFSEPIITEILRDLGVKTHRCNYTRVYVNDEYQGVFVNVERIDQTFIENHLPDSNGLLFKCDEGGPACNLQFIGDDPSAYKRAFAAETKSAKKGHPHLVDFIRMIQQSKDSEIAANLREKLELDDFLRVTAVMLFAGAFDQLTGWNTHNYYLYSDGKQDRWRYLPWDLDVGFCEVAFGKIRVIDDWNAAWPAAGQQPNPLIDRIVADPDLLKQYRDTARQILEQYFEPERLCSIIDSKYALIKDDLAKDPFPHRRITNPDDRSYTDIIDSMKKFVRRRYSTARLQLENPGIRPKAVPRSDGPPPQLVEKVERIMRAAQRMQQKGEDVRPIQKHMEKFGPLMQRGKMPEAEKLLDEVLKLLGEDTDKNPKK